MKQKKTKKYIEKERKIEKFFQYLQTSIYK